MDYLHGRAFLQTLLNPEQKARILLLEQKLPERRYLQCSEVIRELGLRDLPELSDSQQNEFKFLYGQWWKLKSVRNHQFNGVSDLADLYDWMNYAQKEYREPMPTLNAAKQTFALLFTIASYTLATRV